MMKRKAFTPTLEDIPAILDWAREELAKEPYPISVIQKMELAIEEAVANVILHVHKGEGKKLELIVLLSPEKVEVKIIDWGPPCNPMLIAPTIDFSLPIEERTEGGLGVHLMKSILDNLEYYRENGANHLVLTKKI